jgi:hypothetical protein
MLLVFTKLSFSLSHLGENIMKPSFSVDVCLFPGIQILEFHFNASFQAYKYYSAILIVLVSLDVYPGSE